MGVLRAVSVFVVVALALGADADAGGFATVQLSSTPTGALEGEPWSVDLTVLRHGITPLGGLKPVLTIVSSDEERSFPALPTGTRGIYHADVVFPAAGVWEWRIWDGFSQTHTYAPVEVAPGGTDADGRSWNAWLAGLAGVAALAIGALTAALAARRRSRPMAA